MAWSFSRLFSRTSKATRNAMKASQIISRWEIVAEPTCLRVRPTSDELTPEDMALFSEKVVQLEQSDAPSRIVFDFTDVKRFGPSWTPIVAGLVQIARRFPRVCEIVGLHGQPEAAVELYRNNKTLMGMVPRRSAA